jgi:hypothetical protein
MELGGCGEISREDDLTVRVYGVIGKDNEDYDPETAHYDVALNPFDMFENAVHIHGAEWLWLLLGATVALVIKRFAGNKKES